MMNKALIGIFLLLSSVLFAQDAAKPAASESEAYELKGDRVGMSLSDYLQAHPNDCIQRKLFPEKAAAKMPKRIASEYLKTMKATDPNSDFSSGCFNEEIGGQLVPFTLAGERMKLKMVSFTQQRLYRLEYLFSHDQYANILQALQAKFGPPASVETKEYQNSFGAKFQRSRLEWKNGVSTVSLYELATSNMNDSALAVTHDALNAQIESKMQKRVKANQKDM